MNEITFGLVRRVTVGIDGAHCNNCRYLEPPPPFTPVHSLCYLFTDTRNRPILLAGDDAGTLRCRECLDMTPTRGASVSTEWSRYPQS